MKNCREVGNNTTLIVYDVYQRTPEITINETTEILPAGWPIGEFIHF